MDKYMQMENNKNQQQFNEVQMIEIGLSIFTVNKSFDSKRIINLWNEKKIKLILFVQKIFRFDWFECDKKSKSFNSMEDNN